MCSVSKKIYVGIHQTEDPEVFDGYIGCGVRINVPASYMHPKTPFQRAVKKYGPTAFIRTVLKVVDSQEEVLELERQIVDAAFIEREDTYNIALGGNMPNCAN